MTLTNEFIAQRDAFKFREGTCDANVFHNVVVGNEYRLPDRLPVDGWIFDIGAHIGSFTQACLERGARCIVACEPDPENFCRAQAHLAEAIRCGWVTLLPVAVLGRVPFSGLVRLSDYESRPDELNTGGAQIVERGGRFVPAVALQPLMDEFTGRGVELLKLDCEGSEWDILSTLGVLREVRNICGEYHSFGAQLRDLNGETLQLMLTQMWFETTIAPHGDPGLGLFFGRRKS